MNLNNERFGRLTVLGVESKGHSTFWRCLCDCGNITISATSQLINGNKKSCGCIRIENAKKLHIGRKGNRLPFGIGAMNKLFSNYRTSATDRNLPFKISKEEFKKLTSDSCHYCGSEPSNILEESKMNGGYIYNGIDRVDSSLGYIAGNCVTCCINCNIAKSNLDIKDFISLIKRIYSHMRLYE